MKMQAFQTSGSFASMDVRSLNRCSMFTSSDVTHSDSGNPSSVGSTSTDLRVKL